MISLDKLVYVEPRSHPALDQALAAVQFVAQDPEEARALASRIGKDRHLVEAALAADKIVISRDNKCRAALDRVAAEVHELQQIAWVNPADDPAALRAWLEQGCPVEAHRLLGAATDG